MAIDIKAPPYRVFNIAPAVKPGAMENTKTFIANDKIQGALGFPVFDTPDWKEKALGKMGELLGKYRSLKVYMDACVQCSCGSAREARPGTRANPSIESSCGWSEAHPPI